MLLTAMNRTRNALRVPPLPVEPSYFMIPTFIQALFTIPRAYFRQCAHVSIVGCRAPGMIVMGYNYSVQDPPFPDEPSYFMIPTFIQALFTIPRAYFRQCAHVSIVGCRAQRMMVVGYNGIIFIVRPDYRAEFF